MNPRNEEAILQQADDYAEAMIRRDKLAGWPVTRQLSDHDLACAARGRYEGPIVILKKQESK